MWDVLEGTVENLVGPFYDVWWYEQQILEAFSL
jgi:hypothetical protein